jgi:hypothetical protein
MYDTNRRVLDILEVVGEPGPTRTRRRRTIVWKLECSSSMLQRNYAGWAFEKGVAGADKATASAHR